MKMDELVDGGHGEDENDRSDGNGGRRSPSIGSSELLFQKAKNEWNVNAMLYLTEISGSSTHLSAV